MFYLSGHCSIIKTMFPYFQDMNTIDEAIPNSIRSFLSVVGTVLFTVIVICVNIPIMVPIILPIILVRDKQLTGFGDTLMTKYRITQNY